ncbi:YggT family protein [Methylophaga sp. SB9B]|uniref:YggT family protein n=1 Tax=Methylophaga sp. SB9B TaxID=2570356 RepID=UPI0010A92877|nr:YggT family protein [Methylophaga sp. SB9B]THK41526.1 YggT family protein [Methylophaga sp. SB9B]
MPNSYFSNPLMFLIETLFQLYMYIVAVRLLLPLIRTPFTHPLIQTIIRITEPLCAPLRSFMPRSRKFDSAVFLLLVLVTLVKLTLLLSLAGAWPAISGLVLLTAAELFSLFISLFTVTIIIEVLLSWLAPQGYNPVANLIQAINAPLLEPVRRRMPLLGGIDLSPLVVILGLQVLSMLVMPLLLGPVYPQY